MQAKHQVQVSQSQQAQVARLLLQANLAYGESNSNGLSHIQRLKARQECRGYLNEALALEPGFAGADFSAVRSLGCGGAPMPASLLETYLERGVTVCNGMGMTETGPTVFLADSERAAEKIGSVGKAQILADVRLVAAVLHS